MASIYVHWPFCVSKCAYCDFNSIVSEKNPDYEQWLKLYKIVLSKFKIYETEISSIYFGGGTPSLLPPFFIGEVLNFIFKSFSVRKEAEITLEANPGTISIEKAVLYQKFGVNRISVGIQSLYDLGLKILGRYSHTAQQGIVCINQLSDIFENISIDLIYNRPSQTPEEWEIELLNAVDVFGKKIKHISCYELIVEKGTPLQKLIETGKLESPIESDRFFDITHEVLGTSGFEMYEVSNYSKPGYQGQHNISYWKYEDYYGVGPGAHSRVKDGKSKTAIEQEKDIKQWFSWVEELEKGGGVGEKLSEIDIIKEKLIMGLRAKSGVDAETLASIPNIDKKLSNLYENSYIIHEEGKIIMTYEGLKRLNLVIRYILGE